MHTSCACTNIYLFLFLCASLVHFIFWGVGFLTIAFLVILLPNPVTHGQVRIAALRSEKEVSLLAKYAQNPGKQMACCGVHYTCIPEEKCINFPKYRMAVTAFSMCHSAGHAIKICFKPVCHVFCSLTSLTYHWCECANTAFILSEKKTITFSDTTDQIFKKPIFVLEPNLSSPLLPH